MTTYPQQIMDSGQAIGVLHDVVSRGRAERQRLVELLVRVRDAYLVEREGKFAAEAEVARLREQVGDLDGRVERLQSQNTALARDVNAMAAAIHLANQEISESDAALRKVVTALDEDAIDFEAFRESQFPNPIPEGHFGDDERTTSILEDIDRMMAEAFGRTEGEGRRAPSPD